MESLSVESPETFSSGTFVRNSMVDMTSSEVGTTRMASSQDGTHPAQEDSATNLAEVYALYNHMIQLYVSDFQIQLFCVMSIFI